jgi:hypothetical protein
MMSLRLGIHHTRTQVRELFNRFRQLSNSFFYGYTRLWKDSKVRLFLNIVENFRGCLSMIFQIKRSSFKSNLQARSFDLLIRP